MKKKKTTKTKLKEVLKRKELERKMKGRQVMK